MGGRNLVEFEKNIEDLSYFALLLITGICRPIPLSTIMD
jgi:hypothetical protein